METDTPLLDSSFAGTDQSKSAARAVTPCDLRNIIQEERFPFSAKMYHGDRLKRFYEYGSQKVEGHRLPKLIEREVWSMLQDAQHKLESTVFRGNFIKIGSYREGVKVGYPDQFDYFYEMTSVPDGLQAKQENPTTYRPRPEVRDDATPLSSYKLHYSGTKDQLWLWLQLQSEGTPREKTGRELDARVVLNEFARMLSTALTADVPVHASLNGPAVTVYVGMPGSVFDTAGLSSKAKSEFFAMKKKFEKVLIRIDVALAIPVVREEWQSWPLDGVGNVQLADRIKHPIDRCHLVPLGDFWMASFAVSEMKKMESVPAEAKKVFMAIKKMRDFTAVTRLHETSVFSSYPIKTAFFKEVDRYPKGSEWAWEKSPSRVVNILKALQKECEDGSVTGYYIKSDPLLTEADRCCLEIRRINRDMHALFDKDTSKLVGVSFFYGVALLTFAYGMAGVFTFLPRVCWTSSRELVTSGTRTYSERQWTFRGSVQEVVVYAVWLLLLTSLFSLDSARIFRPQTRYVAYTSWWSQHWRHMRYYASVVGTNLCAAPIFVYASISLCETLATPYVLATCFSVFVIWPCREYVTGSWRECPFDIHKSPVWEEIYSFCDRYPSVLGVRKKSLGRRLWKRVKVMTSSLWNPPALLALSVALSVGYFLLFYFFIFRYA